MGECILPATRPYFVIREHLLSLVFSTLSQSTPFLSTRCYPGTPNLGVRPAASMRDHGVDFVDSVAGFLGTFDWERSDDSKILFFPKSHFLFGNVPVKCPEQKPASYFFEINEVDSVVPHRPHRPPAATLRIVYYGPPTIYLLLLGLGFLYIYIYIYYFDVVARSVDGYVAYVRMFCE